MTVPHARRAVATALALLLAALPVAAQQQPPAPGATSEPAADSAEDAGPAAPSDPAVAPPGAANLATAPRPALPADIADLTLPSGFARLPIGGWRLTGTAAQGEPDSPSRLAIETIGRYLAEQSSGRVTIIAQASGPADDPPTARRTSLARAISIKDSLARGGLPRTRIDIRPMGRTDEALDAIDIIAPPASRPRGEAATPSSPSPRGG
ncbi:hypothetical protein [Roseomonas xinghualingensis]|uniref:hypothetical protein n=1 Tax=Roseomonas xinghualingensis TaxID=2986475 RepID=UPI0021F13850|nr:hypothetical protein [Roseomonas sp. SXEYE001]MCV4207951.1 hypothetical protein [Roseomonas sp. SXEYE001]